MGKNGKKKKTYVEKAKLIYNSSIEEDIINILGGNHKKCIVFNDRFEIGGIYTYKGRVYCLASGMDFSIEDVEDKSKIFILNAIKDKKYKIDNSFQG